MWERKSPEEIRSVDRRTRFNPLFALIMASFAATLMTLGRSWGYGGYLLPPLPAKPLLQVLWVFPFFFVVMFLVFYVPQILRRQVKYPDRDAMICDRCHEIPTTPQIWVVDAAVASNRSDIGDGSQSLRSTRQPWLDPSNQAMQLTASKLVLHAPGVCHPRADCLAGFLGLAADGLVSR